MNAPFYYQAVLEIVGGTLSGPSDGPVSEFIFYDGQTPPTEKAIQDKLKELQDDYDALQYQRDRQYPEITDQLDMIYWDKKNSTKKWEEAIDKVKADNPKPE